jgi:hypothetical protein
MLKKKKGILSDGAGSQYFIDASQIQMMRQFPQEKK